MIIVDGDSVTFRDLGSRNGSKINAQPVRGQARLADGDRLRIGNQEIVFTRVVSPRRPVRATGSLRHCRKCQTPYMAEAPVCPTCGYSSGGEVTLSGQIPAGNLDRESWSLQLQLELLDKALTIGRAADADRVLSRIGLAVDERMSAGLSVDREQLDAAFLGALRLAGVQADGQWARWVFICLQRLGRAPSPILADEFLALPTTVLEPVLERMTDTIERWKLQQPALGSDEREAVQRILDARVRMQTSGAAGDAGGS